MPKKAVNKSTAMWRNCASVTSTLWRREERRGERREEKGGERREEKGGEREGGWGEGRAGERGEGGRRGREGDSRERISIFELPTSTHLLVASQALQLLICTHGLAPHTGWLHTQVGLHVTLHPKSPLIKHREHAILLPLKVEHSGHIGLPVVKEIQAQN